MATDNQSQDTSPILLSNDGTSQSERFPAALKPDHVLVDERTLKDLLAFAQAYAGQLNYFAGDNPKDATTDWSGLFDDVDLQEAILYVQNPKSFTAEQARPYTRPHFVLLLVFLELLGHARREINTLTRRHLDFSFREVLRMEQKGSVPDQVHVLVELEPNTPKLRLPAGTELAAGEDSLGQPLTYVSERELIAGPVSVDKLSTLHVERKTIGLREACPPTFKDSRELRKKAFERMLCLALGQPKPGDRLLSPIYRTPSPSDIPQAINYDDVRQAYTLLQIATARTGLSMSSFADFSLLMTLQAKSSKSDGDWSKIHDILERAGEKRDGKGFRLPATTASNWDKNLSSALNLQDSVAIKDFDHNYFGLPANTLDDYFVAFKAIEDYFCMIAEDFAYIMSVIESDVQAAGDDPRSNAEKQSQWQQVYNKLTTAHETLTYRLRRAKLRELVQPDIEESIDDPFQALVTLLRFTLGDEDLSASEVSITEAIATLEENFGINETQKADLLGIVTNRTQSPQPTPEWNKVYTILEIAQRNRESYQVPPLEINEWRNLYPSDDATAAENVATSATQSGNLAYWKTFGRGETTRTQKPVPAACLGWAVASPLLRLAEGTRIITLKLGFNAQAEYFDQYYFETREQFQKAPPFLIELSTEKGWLPANISSLEWTDATMPDPENADTPLELKELSLTCTLAETDPALFAPASKSHRITAAAPAMRLMLKPQWQAADNCYTTESYEMLRKLSLMRTNLKVEVTGLADLTIANDQGSLNAKSPFEPFGNQPATGSSFYLGHPEIVGKKLDSLNFNITWMGKPDNLLTHYTNYPGALNKSSFKTKVHLVENKVRTKFPSKLNLFAGNHRFTPPLPADKQGNPYTAATDASDITQWNRYLQWELDSPDFQHSVYPSVSLQKSLELATAMSGESSTDATTYQVNPPYTPKISRLTLDYTATAKLNLIAPAAQSASEQPDMSCFHIEPFGYAEMTSRRASTDDASVGYSLLPQYAFEGELLVGLRNVTAPQNLALLFQMAEGSADPDLAPQKLHWSYLSGNRWLPLETGDALISDSTRGLINSGIVELKLKPAEPNTLLPKGLYWIRVAIERWSNSVCDTIAVHTNALHATFADRKNAPDHLDTPLAPETIKKPVSSIAEIAKLHQPYSSFGGKSPEQDESFYLRVSERLRHKERALTAWDYERLILEKFSHIYKAKCLDADPNKPGKIDVLVIPDIKNRLPSNPFEPKVSADQIRDIQDFLNKRIPPFVRLKIRNARYVPVRVRCGVRFTPNQDERFCCLQLNEGLKRFLSPWAYNDGADLSIGGKIHANSIIDFIDGQPYVDYVASFKFFVGKEDRYVIPTGSDGYCASVNQADEILVSAQDHVFDIIHSADFSLEEFSGINYMKVGLDFALSA